MHLCLETRSMPSYRGLQQPAQGLTRAGAHQARVLRGQLIERLARAASRRQHLPQRRLPGAHPVCQAWDTRLCATSASAQLPMQTEAGASFLTLSVILSAAKSGGRVKLGRGHLCARGVGARGCGRRGLSVPALGRLGRLLLPACAADHLALNQAQRAAVMVL
jgi:hypothetical protein